MRIRLAGGRANGIKRAECLTCSSANLLFTFTEYALTVNRDRDRDRAALPEPMRNDVRLLGDILGEVIQDSAGPELFADVERLRRAVIDARAGEVASVEIAALVSSWSLGR